MRYIILEKDAGFWDVIYQSDQLSVVLNEARQYSYIYPDAEIKVINTTMKGLDFE